MLSIPPQCPMPGSMQDIHLLSAPTSLVHTPLVFMYTGHSYRHGNCGVWTLREGKLVHDL